MRSVSVGWRDVPVVARRGPASARAQIALNAVAVGCVKAKGLIFAVALSRLLGLAGYGLWIQIFALSTLLAVIAGLGLVDGMARLYPSLPPSQRAALVWTCIHLVGSCAVLVAGCFALAAPWLAVKLGGGASDGEAFRLAAALIPVWALRNTLLYLLRARNRLAAFSRLGIAFELLEVSLVLGGVVLVRSLEAAVLGCLLARTASLAYCAATSRRTLGRPTPPTEVRRLLRYSLPLVPSQLSDEALARGDRLIVGAFMGAPAAGIYSAIYSLASAIDIGTIASINVLFPRAVRASRTYRAQLRRVATTYAAVGAGFVACLALAARPATDALVGSSIGGVRSAAVLAFCGTGSVLLGVGRILGIGLLVRDKTVTALRISAGAAVLNLALDVALVPVAGLIGAAVATAAAYAFYLALHVREFTASRASAAAMPTAEPVARLEAVS